MSQYKGLGDKAKKDLEIVLSLSDEQIDKLIDFIIKRKGFMEVDADNIKDELSEEIKVDPTVAKTVYLSMITISRICSDDKKTNKFLGDVRLLGFDSEQVKTISRIVDTLKKQGLITAVSKAVKRIELQYFGLPHLSSIQLNTDYRVLSGDDGKREIVPVVLCSIELHPSLQEREEPETEKIIFQFTPDKVKDILKLFEEFMKEGKEDAEFITRKGLLLSE